MTIGQHYRLHRSPVEAQRVVVVGFAVRTDEVIVDLIRDDGTVQARSKVAYDELIGAEMVAAIQLRAEPPSTVEPRILVYCERQDEL